MNLAHFVPVVAIAAACVFTGLALGFVLRAQRLNNGDRCGLCGEQLGLEARFRFHRRTVCRSCSQRVRYVTVPRAGRIGMLLLVWGLGALGVVALVQQHDPGALVWGPVLGGLILSAVIAGVLPPLKHAADRTATTLQRLHALLHAERTGSAGSDRD